jgi:tricorn protease
MHGDFLRHGPRAGTICSLALSLVLAASLASSRTPSFESTGRGLMRFPDIHGDTIVFVHGEDIWSVPTQGGLASRLTLHDGQERFPRFSPDGTRIAFTGEYDGNADVYVMDVHGGGITRVTWHPGQDEVVGWHPTNGKILFRSGRHSYSRFSRLFLVSPDGTGLEELPLHEAVQGSYSPDGRKIAYNRESRESRTWKRYRGGNAQDVYIYDFDTARDERLTDFPGTDRIPMWIGDRIYFSSDRDRTLNIYSLDPRTGEVVQLTTHTEYDVRRPSMGDDKIVYELGGALHVLEIATGRTHEVPVEIGADAPEARPRLEEVSDLIQGLGVSPTGKRALVTARGEIFTVPKKGPTRNLTRDSGARDKDAAWSPDGSRIAFISDRSGEYEIHVVDPSGEGEPLRLTAHTSGYRHTLRWSPDSRKIAYADQTLRCFILDVETKKITEVDRAGYEHVDVSVDRKPISDFAWSPDSHYLAYSKMGPDLLYQIHIYSLVEGSARRVSDGRFSDFGPVWARDGRHLLFVSNRHFDPTFGDIEWQLVYKNLAGIYALTLRKDGAPLLPLESDEEEPGGFDDQGTVGSSGGNEDASGPPRVEIDFDGLASRVEALPVAPGNYRALAVGEGVLFYLNRDSGDFNRFEFRVPVDMDLHRFSFADRTETPVIAGIGAYALSADGHHLAYRKESEIGLLPADSETVSEGDEEEHALDLSGLVMRLDPRAEWAQIFHEAWRMERDFYYEPDMHGIDWAAVREKYGRLLPLASCRQDIQFLVGEMIGELNTSHTYVFGGDRERETESVDIGLLGVDWEIDAESGRYRFGRILRVADWSTGIIPPLARPAVEVGEGDLLLSVNGTNVTADRNVYSYFEGLAGQQVRIVVAPSADATHRELVVEPLSSEFPLRYQDWVERNRVTCESHSDGQIGYIHLPDTYTSSAREFPRTYYAQLRKKALVIDGRFNAGGLDPYIFLNRLRTRPLAYWTRRYSHDQTIPDLSISRAHMALLTNRQAGSGGDLLPMEFQLLKMGPVIGTRTWGGLVGVSMLYPMIDGGGLTAPDYRIYSTDGRWVVENRGVTPDIEVDLDPAEMARGYDAQLMKAIEVLLRRIEEDPRPWPEHPPFEVDR